MAVEHVTFSITHTFDTDGYELQDGLPSEIPAGVSLEVVLTLLETVGDALDCTACTCQVYGRPLDSAIADTLLGTGAVSGAGNNVITFTVAKDVIPEGWSLYDAIRFTFKIYDSTHQEIVFQDGIRVISNYDPEDIVYPYSEDIAATIETYAAPATLASQPGLRTIYVNGTTVTLPATPATYTGQMLFIIAVGASANVVARNSKTINGTSADITLNQYDSVILQEYSGNWICLNPTVTV
jgi:hypothetical protein